MYRINYNPDPGSGGMVGANTATPAPNAAKVATAQMKKSGKMGD